MVVSGGVSQAANPTPTRVLIVGDSVTQGADGDYTWRYFASQQLADRAFDFVGPHTGTHAEAETWGGTYADPGFDQDHAARWGMAMWELAWWPNSTPPVGQLIADHAPDVVVVALGVNDLRTGSTPAELRANTIEVVRQIRAADPTVDIVLGAVPQTWVAGADEHNAALPGLTDELTTSESLVTATVPAGWTQADTTDNLHPNTSGQQKLATTFADALAPFLPLLPVETPAAPATPAAPVAPVPTSAPQPAATKPAPSLAKPSAPRHVKAVQHGQRVKVSWRSVRGVESYSVRCGRTVKTVTGTRAVLRIRSTSCKVRATNAAGASVWVRVRA